MGKYDFAVRRYMLARRNEKPKSVHKSWVNLPTGAKALLSDLCVVVQLGILATLYAIAAYMFPIFWYISIALTVLAGVHVIICEKDAQTKSSWLMLFLVSFGCGYIIYGLSNKRFCFGYTRKKYASILERSRPYEGVSAALPANQAVASDCRYLRNAGYAAYDGTDVKYFSDARQLFDNMIACVDKAEHFVFLEYFIVADGVLMERLLSVLKRKVKQGVEVRFLYDDVGCQGVLSGSTKRRIKEAGVRLKAFEPLMSLFNFGLNLRDHRKIVVVDGKTGYVGGCNIADECINERRMQGFWKDAGVRLDGAAVDGLTLTFLRQWELVTRKPSDFAFYTGRYERTKNSGLVVPYAGGPETEESVCRGIYANVVAGAREKLYIMTPYFIPDGELLTLITAKAQSGVDVRVVLPAVPDYPFIYRVTRSNADKLMKAGVKVYFVRDTFVHSKVMLTENCVTVGSVNVDMRAFYLEYDNGVYTDDKATMEAALGDFEGVFAANAEQYPVKSGLISSAVTAVLRVVSPLM